MQAMGLIISSSENHLTYLVLPSWRQCFTAQNIQKRRCLCHHWIIGGSSTQVTPQRPGPGVREFFLDPRIRGVGEAIGRQGAGTDVGLVGALGVLAHDVGPRMDMQ